MNDNTPISTGSQPILPTGGAKPSKEVSKDKAVPPSLKENVAKSDSAAAGTNIKGGQSSKITPAPRPPPTTSSASIADTDEWEDMLLPGPNGTINEKLLPPKGYLSVISAPQKDQSYDCFINPDHPNFGELVNANYAAEHLKNQEPKTYLLCKLGGRDTVLYVIKKGTSSHGLVLGRVTCNSYPSMDALRKELDLKNPLNPKPKPTPETKPKSFWDFFKRF